MGVTNSNSRDDKETLSDLLETHLDETDYEIYRILNENGRISDTELCERVGLSRTAVRRRRKRLEREDGISVVALLNLDALDLDFADVFLSFKPDTSWEDRSEYIDFLSDQEFAYEVHEYIGSTDVLIRVCGESFHDVKAYIHDLIQETDIIDSHSIKPITRTHKRYHNALRDRPESQSTQD